MSFSINAQTPGTPCTYYVDLGSFLGTVSQQNTYSCNGGCYSGDTDLSSCTETEDFFYTGSPQEWIVPCGVTEIQVDARGASGSVSTDGSNGNNYGGLEGGKGGLVEGALSVTPGQVLYIYVGGMSVDCYSSGAGCHPGIYHEYQVGGWNGGGTGYGYNSASAGGGATDIRIGGQTLEDRVVVSGGGGGHGAYGQGSGGHGGGLIGENGSSVYETGQAFGYLSNGTSGDWVWQYYDGYTYGTGGTQSAGGYPWSQEESNYDYPASNNGYGSFGQGGAGISINSESSASGGGGGGGWYGGAGGTGTREYGGGGGGSSYTDPSLVSDVTHSQGVNTGHGSLSIAYIEGDVGSCYVDECGVINGDNTTCMDVCGIPNGDNSSCTDACGVPNGDNSSCSDECGVPNGDNSSCTDECGVPNGDNSSCTDECGVPNGDNSSCSDECGVPNGDNSSCSDECGVPNGDNSSCSDECGVPNGDNSSCTDECGVINGDNSSCSDECGVINGDNSSCSDECGVINGDNSSCSDECGVPNGPGYYYAYIDTDGDGIGEGEIIESCSDLLLENNYVSTGGDIEITGCTNSEADNYLSSANTDDGTCIVSGCMDSNYAEYNENANTDDGSCSCPVSVELNVADASCDLTDGSASIYGLDCNYNSEGPWVEYCLMGDGYACLNTMSSQIELYDYPWQFDACFNNHEEYMCEEAANMYPELMEQLLTTSCYSWTDSEGSLLSNQESVSDLSAGTYTFAYSNGECSYSQSFEVGLSCAGCTDSSAFNYNENANLDDGSCIAVVTGCMDATAFNFNPEANTSDDSCIPVVLGCIDNAYMEYDEAANTDDRSCVVIKVFGCMNDTPMLMSNYNPDANVDDGSCISWEQMVLDLESQLNNIVEDDGVGQADLDAVQGELTLALETIESLNAQISNVDLALTSEDLTYLTEFINGLLTEVSILLNSSELDLNAITGLSETYLTPAIDYLTENDLVSDDQVAMLYEILLQVGVLLGNQEDGIGQADVDAAYAAGAASVTPEDGIGQDDVDAAYAAGAASVEVPEIITEDISMDLPQGWSMFGYTCIGSVDVLVGFASISDKIEIVKDEMGLAYLPDWGFSAFENLEFGEGYQIKMKEEVTDFQFCSTIMGTD